jgi:N-carbamoylputrescine amidase
MAIVYFINPEMPASPPMPAPFTLALVQMQCPANKQESVKKAVSFLEKAAKQGARVACLPELFATEYFCQVQNPTVFDLAEPLDGPTATALADAARKLNMVIVGSIFEKRAPGLYHNTALVFERDGSVAGVYRKMHIPDDPLYYEKYYFTPGDLGFKAIETSAGKLGTLVCWDQWYPEAARLTALQGASVLFYPTAIGWHPKEKAEFGEAQASAWETIQRAHAIANGVYVGAVNRVGHEYARHPEHIIRHPERSEGSRPAARDPSPLAQDDGRCTGDGIEFFGGSFIADPFGRILAKASHDKEEILLAEVNPALIEDTRRNWPFLRDRRVDAYGNITKRFGV